MAKVVNCFCYFCWFPPQGFGICTFNWAGNWSLTLKFVNKLLLDEYWKKNQSKLTYWEKKFWRGQCFRQNSQPASPKFWRMKKNQSFKIPLNVSRENIEIISDFKTQFKILHCPEKSIPHPENWNWTKTSDCKNLNFFVEQQMVRKCRSAVSLSKSCSCQKSKSYLYVTNGICRLDWKMYEYER